MGLLTIILIALALSMDAFAVSVASGIAIKELRIRHALIIGAWFGLFQAIMPILGWVSGIGLRSLITGIDHWIVFGLLFLIGCKMIYESFQLHPMKSRTDPMQTHVLFSLSIATSLDAFAAGISFAMLGISIINPIIIIGAVTFVLSFTGVLIGDRGAHFFEKRMEMAAGIILIAIGVKILIDHLMAG
jgi:putative Mn2+ efflux pump MntP